MTTLVSDSGLGKSKSLISVFVLTLFLFGLGDAILSYYSPIFIEQKVSSSAVMGLIISFSSLVGFACDFLFAKLFSGRSFKFFLFTALLCAFAFPFSLVFTQKSIPILLFAMACWGVYYELIQFSNFSFVKARVERTKYPLAWGLIESFKAAAYMIGPLIAGYFIDTQILDPFLGSIMFFSVALLGYIFLLVIDKSQNKHQPDLEKSPKQSFLHVFMVWKSLWRKIWPLYLFVFTIVSIDSIFWTVGTLLSESMKETSKLGGFLLPAYVLPFLFSGLLTQPISKFMGKKKASFLSGLGIGISLLLVGLVSQPIFIIALVCLSSVFSSIAMPEMSAVFEDYAQRLGKTGEDIVGLQSSAGSLAYILGPIIGGLLATIIGNHLTLSVIGLLSLSVSIICLIVVPKKIRMPQAEIAQLAN